jgi:drug/metabolite transporter (DMT)-like permease
MMFLTLSVLSSTIIAVVFKIQSKLNIQLFPVIVINYFAATFLGFLLNKQYISIPVLFASTWIWAAVLIGTLLILGFYLIGYSTQKIGIAITTISNKMSVVLPILFSIIVYSEVLTIIKISGILLALLSMFFSVYRKRTYEFDAKYVYLPIFLFVTIGIIDSVIKYAQATLTDAEIPVFAAVSFGVAGLVGIIITIFSKIKLKVFFEPKVIATGIIIGAANFGSMFFIIHALDKSHLDSSIVFGVNNIGIIAFSVFAAFLFFKEKFKIINWIGILLSLIAIVMLTSA